MRYDRGARCLTFDLAVTPDHTLLSIQDPEMLPHVLGRLANHGVSPLITTTWELASAAMGNSEPASDNVVPLRRVETPVAVRMPRQLPASSSFEADRVFGIIFGDHDILPAFEATIVELPAGSLEI